MFGYVLTYPPEMKVKEERLYKAIYCGLCKEIKKNVSVFLMPMLSYDFVFLASFRMAMADTEYIISQKRCFLHPLKKRPVVESNPELRYSAVCHLFFTYLKISDDIEDGDISFFKRAGYRIIRFLIKGKVKSFSSKPEYKKLFENTKSLISEGSELEKKGASLDEMCINFGKVLGSVASDGAANNFDAFYFGDMLGRFIYTADALDDAEKDEKRGAFNPIINMYSNYENVKNNISDIDMVSSFYISEMAKTLEKIKCDEVIFGILKNVTDFGLGYSMQKIISKEKK